MRLAKGVHRHGRTAGAADLETVSQAFREILADQEAAFELIWAELSPSKRRIARAVANGEDRLTTRAVLDRYGLGSSASATYGVNELRADGILAPGKPFRISDPFFTAWVAAGT